MTTNRFGHTATWLRSGKVLAVGGASPSAELYDPSTGTWTAAATPFSYRYNATATLLLDGRVFASATAGGEPSIFDPLTETWTDVPGPEPGGLATATLLPNGNVLVAGVFQNPMANAAVYAPTNIGSWTVTGSLANRRYDH